MKDYKPLFPYFGGKSAIALNVWERFGKVDNYVEPFFGSGAVLFKCPYELPLATVNDMDGLVSNFWRALKAEPEKVAEYADWPVNENDLHARHVWMVERKDSLQARLEGDPVFYDAKVAGWWCWGMCCWIGSGFCSGQGPWRRVQNEKGEWVLSDDAEANKGAWRQLVHLGAGRGVNRKRVHLGNAGQGVKVLFEQMHRFAEALRPVRVCCGDWSRVCGDTPTVKQGVTAVFLDPPYSAEAGRDNSIYRQEDLAVAHDVREWAIAHGEDMRIALCGYEGEHAMPESWDVFAWKASGGYASHGAEDNKNRHRERIWFSPACIPEPSLFA